MSPEQFTYWLQGFAEIQSNPPTKEQWKIIKDHLALVFTKVTPKYDPLFNPIPHYKPDKIEMPSTKYEIYC